MTAVTSRLAETAVLEPLPERPAREYHKGLIIDPGIALNEVAADMYRLLDGSRTVAQVAEAVAVSYDIAAADCLPDVLTLGADLLDEGVVREC